MIVRTIKANTGRVSLIYSGAGVVPVTAVPHETAVEQWVELTHLKRVLNTTADDITVHGLVFQPGEWDGDLALETPLSSGEAAGADGLEVTYTGAIGEPIAAAAPVADAVLIAGTAARAVDFEATGSTGETPAYAWDFGDAATSTLATVTHTYAADGIYAVTLTVTDSYGRTDAVTHTVAVAAVPAEAATTVVVA